MVTTPAVCWKRWADTESQHALKAQIGPADHADYALEEEEKDEFLTDSEFPQQKQ